MKPDTFENKLMDRLTIEKLGKLLLLEKERRGIDYRQLLFVGMADIAGYYWCAMKSLLKNTEMETAFFGAYLQDRLVYSHQLGHIDRLPKKIEEWLEFGDEIRFEDIEVLLRKKAEDRTSRPSTSEIRIEFIDHMDDDGIVIRLINPKLSPQEKEYYEQEAQAKGIRAFSWDSPMAPPKLRGEMMQVTKAEHYPTIRWNFAWRNYMVVGVPDGITESFVYEFKTTRSSFLANYYLKPVALAQADLYGYFFRRPNKRVQIYIMDEGKTQKFDEPVSEQNALKTLSDFERLDKGELPKLPKPWKCKRCEFADSCPVKGESKRGFASLKNLPPLQEWRGGYRG